MLMSELSKKTIVIFCAHEDDETLGCGGTIARAVEEGSAVHCIIPVTRIQNQSDQALKRLGVSRIHRAYFDDNQLDKYPLALISKFLEDKLDLIKPDLIITHHYNCMNQDHRVCYEASCIATRPVKRPIPLLTCEVLSSTGYLRPTNFEPNLYVKLTEEQLNTKLEALKLYGTETRADRSPEAIRSLAILRGSESGNSYAEGFMLVRGNV